MKVERFPAQEVYIAGAKVLSEHLEAGRNVAVLCEGDPFFYGSFMYLFGRMADRFNTEIVPGVSLYRLCGCQWFSTTARNDV